MARRIRWLLSPSKLSSLDGCQCFDDNEALGQEHKDRGTDLHGITEKDLPLEGLDDESADAVLFCRRWRDGFEAAHGPFRVNIREMKFKGTEDHPPGTGDQVYLTRDWDLYIFDYKFGVMPVPTPSNNPQILAYAWASLCELLARGHIGSFDQVRNIYGGIVQPATEDDQHERLDRAAVLGMRDAMLEANARQAYPFKTPDPSDADKCARCRWVAECPAVVGTVGALVKRLELLPSPERFEPEAIVSVRDRVVAQDLAKVLVAYAEEIKRNNREYARQNGGSLGGLYFLSARGNGTEIRDVRGFVNGMVDAGLISSPEDVLDFVKLSKTRIAEMLETPEPKSHVLEILGQLEQEYGEPRPPIEVFSRTRKKAEAAKAELDLNVPMLALPEWARRKRD